MKQFILITALLVAFFQGEAFGQSKTPVLFGVQPGLTIEPFYEKGELDVNILPLLFEIPVGYRTNIKLSLTINYHIGGENNGLSDLGCFTVIPVFFRERENRQEEPYGFYIGPVLGFGRNLTYNHYTSTFAMEPGYMFEAKKRFAISLGCQFGGSYFSYDSGSHKWVLHWGPKIIFGFWLNKTE